MKPATEVLSERDILLGVINRFIGFFTRKIQHTTMNRTDIEYPFVAMDTRQVLEQLLFVRDYLDKNDNQQGRAPTFVDIGCGFGNVMLFAEQLDFEVFGLEKDEASLEVARKLFEPEQLIEADIRKYSGYDRFDIIYYFCPLTEGQRDFEKFVEDQMKKDSILIANYKRSQDINSDSRFRRLSVELPIWQKEAV
ncbi:MAG: class I SAM-dependent methyltransferase [Thermodesulfatator sp.]|nr:MAG: class I SAM-dependent methyltransferase [Thermodesulfatator sp.]